MKIRLLMIRRRANMDQIKAACLIQSYRCIATPVTVMRGVGCRGGSPRSMSRALAHLLITCPKNLMAKFSRCKSIVLMAIGCYPCKGKLETSDIMDVGRQLRSQRQVDLPGDRFVAAHLHWGVPKGIVVMGVYLYDDQGLDADNMAIISGILKYVGLLNFLGMDWIVLGDWNLQPE
ncbi:unnamed protein product, partial [Prorocentrum cordatum]